MSAPGEAAPPGYGRILRFFLPLSLTYLILSGATPVINAVITRLPYGVGTGLAAFSNAFLLISFLNGPIFLFQETITRFAESRDGFRRAARMTLWTGLMLLGLDLVLWQTGAAGWLLTNVVRTPAALQPLAEEAFLVLAWGPPALALRLTGRGLLIARQRTGIVGQAVVVRLALTAAAVFAAGRWARLNPAAAAAFGLNLGMLAEGSFLALFYRQKGAGFSAAEAANPGPGYRALAAFVLPLCLANVLMLSSNPLLGGVVQSGAEARAAAAAFGALRSVLLFLVSTTVGFQSLTLVLVRSRAGLKQCLRFMGFYAGGLCLFFVLLAATPLGETVIGDWIGLGGANGDPVALKFALACLWPGAAFPLLVGARCLLRGLLMRAGRTLVVTASNAFYLAALAAMYFAAPGLDPANGALLAVTAWGAAMALEVTVLLVGLKMRI